jgi:glycosyltransferase involved in cell wall biosynthesis
MFAGLPVVITAVGGLVEAAAAYPGAVFVPPENAAALASGITDALALVSGRYPDPHSWAANAGKYRKLFAAVGATGA